MPVTELPILGWSSRLAKAARVLILQIAEGDMDTRAIRLAKLAVLALVLWPMVPTGGPAGAEKLGRATSGVSRCATPKVQEKSAGRDYDASGVRCITAPSGDCGGGIN